MDLFSFKYVIWAIAIGGISAVSLPIGSLLGLQTRPKARLIGALAAFGAGALLAALSVELVAPTVFALGSGESGGHAGDPVANFRSLILGAVVGGLLYVLLDQLVNAHGGFLRKTATSISYFQLDQRKRRRRLAGELAKFPLLEDLPAEHMDSLVAMIRPVNFLEGETISAQDEKNSDMIFVLKGRVRLTKGDNEGREMGPGEVVGIGHLVMKVANVVSFVAVNDVVGLSLGSEDFARMREISEEFDQACRSLTALRLALVEEGLSSHMEAVGHWVQDAAQAVQTDGSIPSSDQLQRARLDHSGAPLAIWLGILLDGIPESFVIGAGVFTMLQIKAQSVGGVTFGAVVPYTLIAGLFLSNFPEALASSANMRLQGWGKSRIFILWFSLMVITAAGAGLGFLLADNIGHTTLIFAEGLAAGAMLTMIAAAMIPEAVHMGNANVVGLGTLAGFLSAICFKLFE
jgi:CRP-like cAMP-binding protein